jgi:hypothetical protein
MSTANSLFVKHVIKNQDTFVPHFHSAPGTDRCTFLTNTSSICPTNALNYFNHVVCSWGLGRDSSDVV